MPATLILPITTRGIGINLCSFYADVEGLLTRKEMPKIYASYRALLALVESRFFNIGPAVKWHSADVYSCSPLLRDYYDVMNIPVIFKILLESIDILKYKDINYIPAMSQDTYIDGNFIPRPENIVLSNLRKTVEALKASDIDDDEHPTLLQHRKNFYKNNPIPGAIWNNNRLMNADDIISSDYDLLNDVYNDMRSLRTLSMQLRKYSYYINTDYTNRNIKRKIFSSFISNEMGELRVPDRGTEQTLRDYYHNSRPENNIDSFYSRFRLRNEHFIKEGAMFLLGEYPNDVSVARPVNELRSKHVNAYFYPGLSYKSSYMSYQNNLFAKSFQNS